MAEDIASLGGTDQCGSMLRGVWGHAPPPPPPPPPPKKKFLNFTPSEIVSGDEIADPQASSSQSQSQTQSFLRAVPLLMGQSQPWVS